jgi:hypothetical protein
MLKLIHRNASFMNGYKEYCQEFWDNNILWFRPTNPKMDKITVNTEDEGVHVMRRYWIYL